MHNCQGEKFLWVIDSQNNNTSFIGTEPYLCENELLLIKHSLIFIISALFEHTIPS